MTERDVTQRQFKYAIFDLINKRINNLDFVMNELTGNIKLIDKENYENECSVDFSDKNSLTYWAFKLKVTKAQLHAARKKVKSNLVENITGYIRKKYSFNNI